MTEKEFIELKDRIANSIYEQITSERSTFKKKDLLYVATQVMKDKLPTEYPEISKGNYFLGSIFWVGGNQRQRTVRLTYSTKKRAILVEFLHVTTFVGEVFVNDRTLTDLLFDANGDSDKLWNLFEDMLHVIFESMVLQGLMHVSLNEEEFFSDESVLFGDNFRNTHGAGQAFFALARDVGILKEMFKLGKKSPHMDEQWQLIVEDYERFAQVVDTNLIIPKMDRKC